MCKGALKYICLLWHNDSLLLGKEIYTIERGRVKDTIDIWLKDGEKQMRYSYKWKDLNKYSTYKMHKNHFQVCFFSTLECSVDCVDMFKISKEQLLSYRWTDCSFLADPRSLKTCQFWFWPTQIIYLFLVVYETQIDDCTGGVHNQGKC